MAEQGGTSGVADPLIGDLLDGRYRVLDRLGEGGMGSVYLAHDERLNRHLVVRILRADLARDDDTARRFLTEATAAASLVHPNIVSVYDRGVTGRNVFLAMEYIPGRTLRDLLLERGRLGADEALALIQPIAAALEAAHRAGVVHRDIKPGNILITGEGEVKVIDFGLARTVAETTLTQTGTMIGTPAYMAPEQVMSGSTDARTDVYAAGVVLYEMLTGHLPYTGGTAMHVLYQVVNEDIPPPSSELPGLPVQLDALIAAATARDPAHRIADAGELLAAAIEVAEDLRRNPAPEAETGNTPSPAPGPQTTLIPDSAGRGKGRYTEPERRSFAGAFLTGLAVIFDFRGRLVATPPTTPEQDISAAWSHLTAGSRDGH